MWLRLKFAIEDAGQVLAKHFPAQHCQPVMQFAGAFRFTNSKRLSRIHRAAVESCVHLHQADTRFPVAGKNRSLYRRSTVFTRQ